MKSRLRIAVTVWLALCATPVARASGGDALFALIIGVNRSVDRSLPVLRYAADDAARFFDLFRLLGARTYLLSDLDANTRRLHPQAAAEAQLPRSAHLDLAVSSLARDLGVARMRGLRSALFVVCAGHGGKRNGQGHIGLQDERLTAGRVESIIAKLGADRTHLIVDACKSEFLARARGPGGQRRPVEGFSGIGHSKLVESVGLLLLTSPTRETHEWEGFQAGVFSHIVRSGLYGAADADGDGRVSYQEIAAFVHRANAAIPNERFRSSVYARPPPGSTLLLDLRRTLRRAINVEPAHHGRYLLEDTRGVRLADFHSGSGQRVRLVHPASGLLYLRRLTEDIEYAVPSAVDVVSLATLAPTTLRTAVRGAAHHAFSLLFALPFDSSIAAGFSLPTLADVSSDEPGIISSRSHRPDWRRIAGWSAIGIGVASLATGATLSLWALSLHNHSPPGESQRDIIQRNGAISRRNTGAIVLYSLAGASAVGAAFLLLWPKAPVTPAAGVGPREASVTLGGRF